MKRRNSIELLTGFLMGSFLGFFFQSAIVILYNLFCAWFGWRRLDLAWWMMAPAPLLLGIVMAIVIANLHLEDY